MEPRSSTAGERREIRAAHTLLASGGFGGDPDLRARLIHPQARDMANRQSTGDGLRLRLAAGAAFGFDHAGFYGHVVVGHVPLSDPTEFVNRTFYHSEHGVLLDLEGKRFCDETVGDHITPLALIEQPEARALFVYDQRVHADWELQPYVEGVEAVDKFELSRIGSRNSRSGGIRVRRPADRCRSAVLDEQGVPIPGLLAADADSGGVFNRAYAGGLANALVFGLQSVDTAVASLAPARPTRSARQRQRFLRPLLCRRRARLIEHQHACAC